MQNQWERLGQGLSLVEIVLPADLTAKDGQLSFDPMEDARQQLYSMKIMTRKNQLVQEEEKIRDRVSMKVSFILVAIGGWFGLTLDKRRPAQSNSLNSSFVYMALAFGSSWFVFVRMALVATFGLAAAQKLLLKILRSGFHAPIFSFDSTPVGRILNWVSIDQSVDRCHKVLTPSLRVINS
ncbi:ABC transporter C family member 5, partial [Mucuna pruriens]